MQGAAKEAHPGEVVGGRFRIEAELGEGGMAQVYKVTDVATSKSYALKLIKQDAAADPQAMARLRREGEVLTNLNNPAVVAIETFGKLPDGRLFIAMELLEGETLGDRMRREKRLATEALIPIVTGAAAGLTAAHQAGVIHRDLKPDNIFLQSLGGDRMQVKLLDFGISKVYGVEERLTRTGQILGTPRYMAPEQLAADHDLDGRVDTYALGVILYEALAGSPPFIATSPSDLIVSILHGKVTPLSTLRSDLPEDVVTVVMRAMARAREARYSSPRELAEAFLEANGGRESTPGPRHGVGTAVLGGGGQSPLSDPKTREEGLRLGTFSAMQPLAPPSSAAPIAKTVAGKKRPQAVQPPPSSGETPLDARSDASDSFPLGGASDSFPLGGASDSFPLGGASDSFPLGPESGAFNTSTAIPTHSRRWLWVVAALIAGGLSAALALFLLQSSAEEAPEPEVEAAQPAMAIPVETMQATAAPEPAEAVEVEVTMEMPAGAVAPSDESTGSSSSQRRRRRERDRETMTAMETTTEMETMETVETMVPDPYVSDTRDPYDQARDALHRGDANACISILRDARLRGASALRLEGDCYLRAGRQNDAVKAYEEFCRRYPSNSSTAAIRGLVESLGGSCP